MWCPGDSLFFLLFPSPYSFCRWQFRRWRRRAAHEDGVGGMLCNAVVALDNASARFSARYPHVGGGGGVGGVGLVAFRALFHLRSTGYGIMGGI